MTELEERLSAMFEAMGERAPHDRDLLGVVRAKAGRRWPSPKVAMAAAAAAAAIAVAVPVLALRGDSQPEPAGYTCADTLTPDLLPEWAQDGFGDEPVAPYVIGADNSIVGVVFGGQLRFPPPTDRNNKVLWVPRAGGGELTIRGRLVPGNPPVVIESETGPSILDLPAPGCWHLDLSWPGGTDSVNMRVIDESPARTKASAPRAARGRRTGAGLA